MTSSLPLSFPFILHHHCHKPHTFLFISSHISHSYSKSFLCFSSSNPSSFDREEIRWLREEQRWLREEQRWLREEQRWIHERESLLREISDLKLQIQVLEYRNSTQGTSVSETIASIGTLLQVLKEKNRIADSGSSASSMVLEENKRDKVEEEEKHVVLEEVRVLEEEGRGGEEEKSVKKKRRVLKMGSEGEDVREMQEALLKLGFYSGEEDMKYSSFSSGTKHAVETWQASLHATQDGIMAAELLERLHMEQLVDRAGSNMRAVQGERAPETQEEGANGAAVASVTQISEIQHKVVKEEGTREVEVSQHRVFLLGENRWEEPSRLVGRNKQGVGSKSIDNTTKCLTCRGEGRLMCIECDGTGEPNVEPQFLEWIDERSKCPYCEGLGYTICVCVGKTVVSQNV